MSRPARIALAVAALAGLGALIVWAVTGVTPFGHPTQPYARLLPPLLDHERRTWNSVNGITYDLRGLDTLGEELILYVAALGTAVLLRHGRGEKVEAEEGGDAERGRPATSGALRAIGAVLVGPLVVLGVYVVTHGHLTPGGGFQGGIILAAGTILVYAAGQVLALERIEPTSLVEVAESCGALAFAMVAVGGLIATGAALYNFLPYGTPGALLSSGTIVILSIAVGVEVTGAVALIFTEFLDQTLLGGRE